MKRKRNPYLQIFAALFIVLSSSIHAGDTYPASFTIKLAKETLALAEPTMLTLEITNNCGHDLLIHKKFNYALLDRELSFFLIDPKGEVSSYVSDIKVTEFPNSYRYAALPSGSNVTIEHFMWWTQIVSDSYRKALEKLPSGSYKLYAEYELPNQAGLENVTLYSDTFEFTFLPFDKANKAAIEDLNSLSEKFLSIFNRKSKEVMERVADSNSLYSEAAAAAVVSWIFDYDSLERAKAVFDRRYPNSVYSSYLMQTQFYRYRDMINPVTSYQPKTDWYLDAKADSLLQAWKAVSPKSLEGAIIRKEIREIKEEEK